MQSNGTDEFPVVSQQAQKSVDGLATEVLCQRYSDRILILISQIGKVGCLYQVSQPAVSSSLSLSSAIVSAPELAELNLPAPDPAATIVRLLGSPPSEDEELLYELYARQIAALIYADVYSQTNPEDLPPWAGRGIIVGLALKRKADDAAQDDSARRQELAMIIRLVKEARVW